MSVRKISAGIKSRARYALAGHLGTCFCSCLLYFLIGFILMQLPANVFSGDGIASFILYALCDWLILSFLCILRYGLSGIFIALQYGQKPGWQDLFAGFKENTNKILIVGTILSGAEMALLLPAGLVLNFYNGSFDLLIGLILSVAGSLGVVFLELTFGLSWFILLDYPDVPAAAVLRQSAKLMKGNRSVLFYIYVSYIPLFLLGLLSLGIGDLFVYCYFLSAQAAFYRSLVAIRSGKIRSSQGAAGTI